MDTGDLNVWDAREASAKLESDGAWLTSRAVPGWRFLLRRLCNWNKPYYTAVARIAATPGAVQYLKKVSAARAAGSDYVLTPEEKKIDIYLDTASFVEGCVVGWQGVTGPDGAPLAFTRENAIHVFTHFRNLYDEAYRFARGEENYRFSLIDRRDTARGN